MWGTPALDQSYDWIAISATFLDGVYIGDAFAPFREIDPSDRAGYSILLYDARRPEVRRAVELTQARLR